MGREIARLATEAKDVRIAGGLDVMDGEGMGFPICKQFSEIPDDLPIDVVVDFSRPETLPSLLEFCDKRKLPVIIATTGFGPEELDAIQEASSRIPVFKTANMSLGINLMMQLLRDAAAFLGDSDIEIVERHHNTKADAPSGTALVLADAINSVFLGKKEYTYGRHSRAELRRPREIGIHAVRGGTVAGDHSVMFLGKDEELTLSHSASSRQVFAVGALEAARFMKGKGPGYYDMQDILLEKSSVTHIDVEPDIALVSLMDVPFGSQSVAALFSAVAKEGVNVDMISQNANSSGLLDIAMTLPLADKSAALRALEALGYHPSANEGVVKLTATGQGMERQSGVAARLFSLFAENDIPLYVITTSETKIGVCIDKSKEKLAVRAMRTAFGI